MVDKLKADEVIDAKAPSTLVVEDNNEDHKEEVEDESVVGSKEDEEDSLDEANAAIDDPNNIAKLTEEELKLYV